MAEITNRDILSNAELEVSAACGQYEGTFDRRSPDNIAVNDSLDVFENGVSMIVCLSKFCIRFGAQQNRIWAVDTDETQLA